MRVKCIDNENVEGQISVGSIYDVIKTEYISHTLYHYLIDDVGIKWPYLVTRFIELDT